MSDDLEQVIICPCCQGRGWTRHAGRTDWHECPVCETRGFLVIDGAATLRRPEKPIPGADKRNVDPTK